MALIVLILKIKKVKFGLSVRLMMILMAASVGFFVVKIGGDPRHYRFLAFSFCLASCAFGGLPEHFLQAYFRRQSRLLAPVLGIGIVLTSLSFYPPQIDRHPLKAGAKHRTVKRINDALFNRVITWKIYDNWGKRINQEIVSKSKDKDFRLGYKEILVNDVCWYNYLNYDKRIVHSFGLTDAILARTAMKSERAAHKYGLIPLAYDISNIERKSETIGRGMFRLAVEKGIAPRWIERNLMTIEVIEKKMYNRHSFLENLRLAFTFLPKIKPGGGRGSP
jgi:hypothetical protein